MKFMLSYTINKIRYKYSDNKIKINKKDQKILNLPAINVNNLNQITKTY